MVTAGMSNLALDSVGMLLAVRRGSPITYFRRRGSSGTPVVGGVRSMSGRCVGCATDNRSKGGVSISQTWSRRKQVVDAVTVRATAADDVEQEEVVDKEEDANEEAASSSGEAPKISKIEQQQRRTGKVRKQKIAQDQGSDGARKLRVALICGGPSQERGISLNSARSVLDHLQGEDIGISCFYLDTNLHAYAISDRQMYSNTPSDFDYKLSSMAQGFKSFPDFLQHLQVSADIVFPVLHGQFGEDGGIQNLLESAGIPFVGTSSAAAQSAFDKATAAEELGRLGFATLPCFLLEATKADQHKLTKWFEDNNIDVASGRVVVKPARAGSSVGVSVAVGVAAAAQKAEALIAEGVDDRVVIEVFAEGGKEFTAIVLDLGTGYPVALLPTEVELRVTGEADAEGDGGIFNFRRKYLPTRQVLYHNPPRFPVGAIAEIRSGAGALFKQLGLRDFARVDGWLLPPSSRIVLDGHGKGKFGKLIGQCDAGTVVFSDINLMSGMEQTSFLFQQAAQVGWSHVGILRSILLKACSRYPSLSLRGHSNTPYTIPMKGPKKKVFVLFGGSSSERQVSLISGTNVWLNLRACNDLDVSPFLLSPSATCSKEEDSGAETIWALPYSLVLRHTVEEIVDGCVATLQPSIASVLTQLREQALAELNKSLRLDLVSQMDLEVETPRQLTLENWIKEAKACGAVVFIAVHGGIGENGVLQEMLEASGVSYTGPGVEASRVCSDKVATGLALGNLSEFGVFTARRRTFDVSELLKNGSEFGDAQSVMAGTFDSEKMWDTLRLDLQATSICVKPSNDGCSTGVAKLCCPGDLEVYLQAVLEKAPRILPGSLSEAHSIIEMPDPPPKNLILEQFIETDDVIVTPLRSALSGASAEDIDSGSLSWVGKSRWLEVTVGVLGKKGELSALNPSITVKESGAILSLEEKFQGGTGVNLTPPPSSLVSQTAIVSCKKRIELVANTLGIEGFARLDAFLHVDTGEIIVIEANTVPGMTPSTVLVHQALAEIPPIYPRMFFRAVVNLALAR